MMRAQAAQTIGDALGSDAIVAIIDVFGGFYEDLVRAHNEIASERVELSRLVKRVRQEVSEETSSTHFAAKPGELQAGTWRSLNQLTSF